MSPGAPSSSRTSLSRSSGERYHRVSCRSGNRRSRACRTERWRRFARCHTTRPGPGSSPGTRCARRPVSVTIRPGRSENPATSQKSNGTWSWPRESNPPGPRYECGALPRERDQQECFGDEKHLVKAATKRVSPRRLSWQVAPPGRAKFRGYRTLHHEVLSSSKTGASLRSVVSRRAFRTGCSLAASVRCCSEAPSASCTSDTRASREASCCDAPCAPRGAPASGS